MMLDPRALPRPHPSLQQLLLPFDGLPLPSPLLRPLVAETDRMSVRPRAIWRTLSPAQREQVQRTLRWVAADLLREGVAHDHRP